MSHFRPRARGWTSFLRRPLVVRAARTSAATLQVVCAIHLINEHVFEIRNSTGASMLPTLAMEGDFLLQLRLPLSSFLTSLTSAFGASSDDTVRHPYHGRERIGGAMFSKNDQAQGTGLRVGDLVVALSPFDPTRTVCKRVIGLPGDTVCLDPRMRPLPMHAWRGRGAHKPQPKDEGLGGKHVRFEDILSGGDSSPTTTSADAEKELGSKMVKYEELLSSLGVPTQPARGEVDVFASMDTDAAPTQADTVAHNTAALEDLEHSYVRARGDVQYVTVPLGHVWLAGDNLANSTDSRHYGPVPLGMVRGKVVARVYPNPRWLGNNLSSID
ncbi:related to IMP1 - protease, mitochondrial [Moesziomyces antarcticus]|nr:related to IMP1 - protease, mitochondrial [Moesziomyces antarcticus]